MTLDWQNIVALGLALAAAGYLGHRGWQTVIRKRSGCGACGSCPAEKTSATKTLVPLESLTKPR